MQTPTQVTLEAFYQKRKDFLSEKCHSNGASGRVLCRACGTRIKTVAAQIEIHEWGFRECRGNGEQFDAPIPYCPACEELPAGAGCVHV